MFLGLRIAPLTLYPKPFLLFQGLASLPLPAPLFLERHPTISHSVWISLPRSLHSFKRSQLPFLHH